MRWIIQSLPRVLKERVAAADPLAVEADDDLLGSHFSVS